MSRKRVGIFTGGGDAPGLNGIIESITRTLIKKNYDIIGIKDGFEGIYNDDSISLTVEQVQGNHAKAGSLLGASNKSPILGREKEFIEHYKKLDLQGVIVVGGDGTFTAISYVSSQIKVIGLPKTIDNDLAGTDVTFGYDTACAVVSEAADSLRVSAETHKRILVVETMGRTAGWIALGGGLASYADIILIPERPFDRQNLIEFILKKKNMGRRGLVIVISEGAFAKNETPLVSFKVKGSPQQDRYGGIGQVLSRWIEKETNWESRDVILGHLQRSHPPTTTDRFLTLAMGIEAARMVEEDAWGQAVVYRAGRIQRAPVTDLMKAPKLVDSNHKWIQLAQDLGIYISDID